MSDPTSPSPPRKTRHGCLFAVFAGASVLLIVMGGVLWYFDFHRTGHLAKLRVTARSHSYGGGAATNSDPAWNACESVVLVSLDENRFQKQIVDRVAGRLAETPGVKSVMTFRNGVSWKGKMPDLFLTIRAAKTGELATPFTRELKAEIRYEAGTKPWGGHATFDTYSPPVAVLSLDGQITHESKTTGFETRMNMLAAKHIGDEIADRLEKDLAKHRKPPPALPTLLTTKTTDPPAFAFLSHYKAAHVASGPSLLMPCRAFWWFITPDDPNVVLDAVEKELKGAGWWVSDISTSYGFYMRATKATQLLTLERLRRTPGGDALAWDVDPSKPAPFLVQYQDRLGPEATEAALDQLVAENAPLETLMAFKRFAHPRHATRYVELLEQSPRETIDDWMDLFRFYRTLPDESKARAAIDHASELAWKQQDYRALEGTIRYAAQSAGYADLAGPLDPQRIRESGAAEYLGTPVSVEVDPDERVVFFRNTGEEHHVFVDLTPKRGGGLGIESLSYDLRRGGNRTMSDAMREGTVGTPWRQGFGGAFEGAPKSVLVEPLPGGRFRLTLEP